MQRKLISLLLVLVFSLSLPLTALGNTGYVPDKQIGQPQVSDIYQNYTYPTSTNLSRYVIQIEDQESDPWCVVYGVIGAVEAQMRLNSYKVPEGGFSQAYLYARCKQLDGIPNTEGTYIRTALQIAMTEGLCPEALCPTDVYKNTGTLPIITQDMKDAASNYKILSYKMITDTEGYADVDEAKSLIASNHFIVMGSFVEQSWNYTDGGWLLEPYGYIRGGHCTFIEGYDGLQQYLGYTGFIDGVNSWGEEWGISGRFEMSYNYADFRDLSVGMPMVTEMWSFEVTGEAEDIRYVNMPVPLQIINPGYTMLPFRVVFEALGGVVEWGYNTSGKIWVRGTVELKDSTVTLEMTQGDPILKVIKI